MNRPEAKSLVNARNTITAMPDNFRMGGWMLFDDTKEETIATIPVRQPIIKKPDRNMYFCIAAVLVLQSVGVMRCGTRNYAIGRPITGADWITEARQAIGVTAITAECMFFAPNWQYIDPFFKDNDDPTAEQAERFINRVLASHNFDPNGNRLPDRFF